ncbi:protein SUPPRESSOR OF GENE SILENCING 3 homolog isoform X1 [Amborella trichopoda]|nr:protein SUPPRESSOR OF GENE SILENCING 3 homolog isoform X1 [Amborella trichopoda]|eukprot:XP_020519096.1 protein SUPPRESSOR OF GENE SILENCING 3 homolog isoform X1 [Amborella trichopoda]
MFFISHCLTLGDPYLGSGTLHWYTSMLPKKNSNPGGANSSPKTKSTIENQHWGSSSGSHETTRTNPASWADASEFSVDVVEDWGEWEAQGRKSRKPKQQQNTVQPDPRPSNLSGRAPNNNWHQQSHEPKKQVNSRENPWLQTSKWEADYIGPPPVIPPPLENGWQWQWQSQAGSLNRASNESKDKTQVGDPSSIREDDRSPDVEDHKFADSPSESDDLEEDSDDDLLSDGDYDSDISQKSHSELKKNKWYNKFFETMDELTVEDINDPLRQWHCPACAGGPGAIDWYKGMQPLVTHAKTKGSNRVRLHRKFAELLEEELQRRGTSAIPAGELFGKWKGLHDAVADHEIVWPPMVIIQNTLLDRNDNDMWTGMGNPELVEYFKAYEPAKARHSYGSQGHRGLSVLLFDASAIGYLKAECLHKHFMEEGRDRDTWDRRRVLFHPGGKRVLYGYLATKEDMDSFNRYCDSLFSLYSCYMYTFPHLIPFINEKGFDREHCQ